MFAMRRFLVLILLALMAPVAAIAATPATDALQQAVNYVFTGKADPQDRPLIVDSRTCAVVVKDRKFNRFVRYYLSRFKMSESMITKRYSGSKTIYELDVEGDAIILEYLAADRTTVLEAFKSAQIPLPGEIERTRKALHYIFSGGCTQQKEDMPF
jgi:hypothetical protein